MLPTIAPQAAATQQPGPAPQEAAGDGAATGGIFGDALRRAVEGLAVPAGTARMAGQAGPRPGETGPGTGLADGIADAAPPGALPGALATALGAIALAGLAAKAGGAGKAGGTAEAAAPAPADQPADTTDAAGLLLAVPLAPAALPIEALPVPAAPQPQAAALAQCGLPATLEQAGLLRAPGMATAPGGQAAPGAQTTSDKAMTHGMPGAAPSPWQGAGGGAAVSAPAATPAAPQAAQPSVPDVSDAAPAGAQLASQIGVAPGAQVIAAAQHMMPAGLPAAAGLTGTGTGLDTPPIAATASSSRRDPAGGAAVGSAMPLSGIVAQAAPVVEPAAGGLPPEPVVPAVATPAEAAHVVTRRSPDIAAAGEAPAPGTAPVQPPASTIAAQPGIVATPPEAPRAAPIPPSRQVLPMAIAMLISPGVAPTLSVTLDPGELGRLEIRVSRGEGGTSLRLIAERPETAALLARDQRELQQGLAQSGIVLDTDRISFEMAGDGGARQQQPGGRQPPQTRQAMRELPAIAAIQGSGPLSLLDMRV